jgi:hypothetical protein
MPSRRDRSNAPHEIARGQYGEKAESDQRRRLEAAGGKICVKYFNYLVESAHGMLKLRAHAANEQIAEERHFAENNRRPILELAVGLSQRR